VITPPTFGEYLRHLRTTQGADAFPVRRRTPPGKSLNRTKLAAAADVSAGYLIKLEQGHADNPSSEVVDRLATALGVRDVERQHMHDLAEPALQDRRPIPAISDAQREFVNHMHPHLSGYVDIAWNVLYANTEYRRIYRNIEVRGNVLLWFFAERQSRSIMVEWEVEARLTVAWLRSNMARRRTSPVFKDVLSKLAQFPDFERMWRSNEILMGRHTPYMRVRDLDNSEEMTLRAEVFPTPNPQEALQIYVGVRTNEGI